VLCGNGVVDSGEACDPDIALEQCPAGTAGSRVCSVDCTQVIDTCVTVTPIPDPTDANPGQVSPQ
jgi:hypothetical protein